MAGQPGEQAEGGAAAGPPGGGLDAFLQAQVFNSNF